MPNPTKQELLESVAPDYETDRLTFDGLRGDAKLHLAPDELERRLAALPPAPKDRGTLDYLVARTADFGRACPSSVMLSVAGGLEGDRWVAQDKYGPEAQLATARTDFARVIANGQALELHGDNLFLSLDLSTENLPPGSRVRVGPALLEVTPKAHNGCKKWVQRFGLAPMRLNLAPHFADRHLRGIYLRVIEAGVVRVGDEVRVVRRGPEASVA